MTNGRRVDYIARTRELYAPSAPYRWADNRNRPVPWTPLTTPPARARVALLGTGGVHLDEQEPFHFTDDTSIRIVPTDATVERLRIAHFGYPTADAERDAGCVFPLGPLAQLAAEGVIGGLAPSAIGMMGGIYSQRRVRDEVVPAVLERLREEEVSLLYLVPACPVCHQTVGLIARAVEQEGIPTLTMSVGRDITDQVRPPRAVFLNYPMGNTVGRPHHPDEQLRVVRSAFAAVDRMSVPGTLVELDMELEATSPDGRPWQDFAYTKEFRRRFMKKRDGTRWEG